MNNEISLINKSQRNIFVDIYKLILVLFVVLIHCNPWTDNQVMYYCIRIAVPGFLVISGFFFYKENVTSNEDKAKRALKFFLTSLKYLVIGIVFAAISELIMGFVLKWDIAKIFSHWFEGNLFSNFFITNSAPTQLYGFQLWYLIAVFLSWLIIFILFKLKLEKVIYFLPLLIFVQLFFSVWLKFIPGQENIVSYFLTRNAYFMALPCIALGYDLGCLKKYKMHWSIQIAAGVMGCAFFVMQFYEMKSYGFLPEISVCTFLAAACFAYAIGNLPKINSKLFDIIIGRNGSLFIFIYHVFVYKVFSYYTHIGAQQHLGIYTFLMSLGTYLVLHWLFLACKFGYIKLTEYIAKKKSEKTIAN